ncbi:MAG TPA: class I SAM-dependent methyltransferase [Polyangiales bacterium]|nr:class I SAM-dependent methyltransferase [Polyangiales bacterium]
MKRPFIPAAGYDFALRFYDPFTRWLGADAARNTLIQLAELRAGQRVLDLGCGTGTLLVAAKRSCPGAELIGLDPDERALARAREKAAQAGVSLQFQAGYADELPFAPASFDSVLSSLMVHHLDVETQARTVHEIARVLKPGGKVHILDFAKPHEGVHGVLGAISRFTGQGGIHIARDLPALLRGAGLVDIRAIEQPRMFFHTVMYYGAARLG